VAALNKGGGSHIKACPLQLLRKASALEIQERICNILKGDNPLPLRRFCHLVACYIVYFALNDILQILIYNLRISHSKGSFVQKIQQNAKKHNKTPSAFPLRLLLFVPCRGFFDLPALSALRLFKCGFLSILYLSTRFFAVF